MPEEAQGTWRQPARHDRVAISALLEKILTDIGPERFSGMRLMQLEKLVRTYDAGLPGKTVLREVINTFRTARWPNTAPKKLDRWTR